MRFAEIHLGHPLEKGFTYRVPEGMEVAAFSRVIVNFNGRRSTGYVVSIADEPGAALDPERIKDVLDVVDQEPVFDARLVDLARYIAGTYLCSLGEALAMALPSAPRPSARHRPPFVTVRDQAGQLTEEQRGVFDSITAKREKGGLLHLVYGITGSGKTELYIALAQRLIAEGLSVIYCVPEISLSSQIYERLHRVFGDDLVLYHSGLTAPQRLHHWMRFYRGDAKIAVGTRSAVFLQCPRLGMIVIDEEHDPSYKEHSTPRYNARRVALRRSRMEGSLLVLGSATPAVETLYAAERGVFELHRLENRYGGAALPEIEIVPVKGSRKSGVLLSNELKVSGKRSLDRGEQIILLLNRRGFAPIVICEACGNPETCPDCSISLTLHREGSLLCHYCGYARAMGDACTTCGQKRLLTLGSGTQRVEEMVQEVYRDARIFRLDQDSSRKKGVPFEMVEKMRGGDIDVLLGTQMVAKGFDFPNVSVVGVLTADIGLNMPDFRSSERIFALLTQVSGRCGRGDKPGRVIIQTLNVENPIFCYLKNHDYTGFYKHELGMRRELRYPPFSRLARLLARGTSEGRVIEAATLLGEELKSMAGERAARLEVLGPSPAPMEKIGGNHRWHIIIKTTRMEEARDIIRLARARIQLKEVYLEVDIDPFDLM